MIKLSKIVILFVVIVLCVLWYNFFYIKTLFGFKAQAASQSVVIQHIQKNKENNIVLDVHHDHDKKEIDQNGKDYEVDFVIMPEKQTILPVIVPEKQTQCTEDYYIADYPIDENNMNLDECSFVTMSISNNYQIDIETQYALDVLIGNDFHRFIHLVLQSNNNVLSKEVCKSCSLLALLKKVKKHKHLTVDEIKTLQRVIGNVYRFVETMKSMSTTMMLSQEQYQALVDLNRPENLKKSMNLQARKTAAAAALKKLQSMQNR